MARVAPAPVASTAEAAPPAKGSKKLILIIALVLAVLGAGGAAALHRPIAPRPAEQWRPAAASITSGRQLLRQPAAGTAGAGGRAHGAGCGHGDRERDPKPPEQTLAHQLPGGAQFASPYQMTDQNLARVTDVINEVARQIGSLKRQAAKGRTDGESAASVVQKAREAQVEKDREANRQLILQQEQKAVAAQIRQLIEAHGGTLELMSEPGQGTTAIVELP
mgnify:CR=1 FL=1